MGKKQIDKKERNTFVDNAGEQNNLIVFTLRIILPVIIFAAIILSIIMPQEEDSTFWVKDRVYSTDENEVFYEGDFDQVMPDGSREAIELPGKYTVAPGEDFVVETTLPEDYDDSLIILRASQQNMKIYVGDELRVNYDTTYSRPFGSQTTSRYVMCPTGPEDANKILRIVISHGAHGYEGRINKVYACDKFEFWNQLYHAFGPTMILALIIVLIGVFTVGISYILTIGFHHRFNLEYLGWLLLVAGGWQIASSELRQFLVPNVSVFSYLEFIALMIAPIPFALYMNGIQHSRFQKIYSVFAYLGIGNFLLQILLQVLDIANFIDMLTISHVILGAAIFFCLISFVLDLKGGYIREYKLIFVGMLVLMGCTIIEIVAAYLSDIVLGYVLAVGVVQFVGMAIYQTIMDVRILEEGRRKDREGKILADNANRAKSQFLASMSHEIRTPINAVLGMNTMILRKSNDQEILKYAGDIQSAGKTLLSIINDILDFSKIESGKMNLVPVGYEFADILNDINNMIGPKARDKDLTFEMEIDPTIPCRMFGDDVRIRQILVNLMTNAVKYTDEGKVVFSVRRNQTATMKEDTVSLHFEVSDTGMGIKSEDLDKLTQEFVRIEESRNRNVEGTGLGISIVGRLLGLMGSKLEVESVYGEGSTFYFDLTQPVINPEEIGDIRERIAGMAEHKEEKLAEFRIPDVRLLVVDDTPLNRLVFVRLLEHLECRIDEAVSGMECLDLIEKNHYDIIFMDHMMPEMDGVETFRRMREKGEYLNSDTPVVILTANAISGAREEYLEEGFVDYLSKPIEAESLEAIIGALVPEEKKQFDE